MPEQLLCEQTTKRADRFNEGKPQWTLLDFPTLEGMVRVLEFGAEKYGRDNWKKGRPVCETADSLIRHVVSYLNGEDLDQESGLHHLDHVMCNAMFLRRFAKDKNLDDRNE